MSDWPWLDVVEVGKTYRIGGKPMRVLEPPQVSLLYGCPEVTVACCPILPDGSGGSKTRVTQFCGLLFNEVDNS